MDMVNIAKELRGEGFSDMIGDDIREHIEDCGEPFTNEELGQLTQSHTGSDDDVMEDTEAQTPSDMTLQSLPVFSGKRSEASEWPVRSSDKATRITEVEELPQKCAGHIAYTKGPLDSLIDKLSDIRTLRRIVAYVYRFTNNSRKGPNERTFGEITLAEICESDVICVNNIKHLEAHAVPRCGRPTEGPRTLRTC
uniref:Uncharacterized protein n=1 Tax=Trichuris muris TaxID=70415 RepID=A0A5S6Q1Q6_TRIMR